jgi:hypothetical protein
VKDGDYVVCGIDDFRAPCSGVTDPARPGKRALSPEAIIAAATSPLAASVLVTSFQMTSPRSAALGAHAAEVNSSYAVIKVIN